VHLRALLLLRTGADARLTDELPADEVGWLRERAPAWSIGALMQLVQTLSDALARTRDAAQFQVQTEVALLTACDVESRLPAATHVMVSPPADAPAFKPTAISPTSEAAPGIPEPPPAEPEELPPSQPQSPRESGPLSARWPDVIEHVKRRNGLLASIVTSAVPLRVDDSVLVVAFTTEYNRKSAEKSSNRQIIETAFERVYGSAYRLRATVPAGSDGPGLLEDPVINYAARTFGGQPRRVD